MKRYPKYKSSNIPWIGEMPEHWDEMKLKYYAMINPSNVDKNSSEDEEEVLLCNYIDVYKNEFISSSLEFMRATATKSEIKKFTVEKGDVIATKDSETPTDIANPALVREEIENLVCGYHLTHIRTERSRLLGEYLFRLLQSKNINAFFEISANGITRYGLGVDAFKNVLILLPSIQEQLQIVFYLDSKTQKIDKLISNKQKQIELLKEERQAIINNAVTGRITSHSDPVILSQSSELIEEAVEVSGEESNPPRGGGIEDGGGGPAHGADAGGSARAIGGKGKVVVGENVAVVANVEAEKVAAAAAEEHATAKTTAEAASKEIKYKSSGIPWLGDIPEHWILIKLKYLVGYVKGYAFKVEQFKLNGIPVVKASDIKNLSIRTGKDFLDPNAVSPFYKVKLYINDIIISTVGSTPDVINSAVGQVAKIPKELEGGYLNQNSVKIFPLYRTKLDHEFFFYLVISYSFRKHLDINAHGTANQASLNIHDVLDYSFALPSFKEQKIIVNEIKNSLTKIDFTISQIDKEILLLQEYRTALISEVVTGKIDVREELVS